ncbi:HrcA family transcriptional regulator [Neosynechococcus sphagnicola sy1]|uniref:Heat-inducible transcription repressor HrcA n=1 Tax=Neosynechococcus sphagnicola sy1 TaxID=1497020 RepID=A0A098TLW5_9CYAN|nr:heat-inducible transcriptional repressor HrcA [Neosynechococcus sphagnicola]KGF73251.1 HrcA family transcriptional regulator [Neosynechococcus sphagnicola sy1]
MSVQVHLTERQQQVLWATVRHYIATAEPVGSKALVEEYNLSVSPATIRNAMGVLEKVGLLYQPHTSAGRIPSDSGYRIYVDQLITPSRQQAQQVEELLSDRLNWEDRSFESLLRGAAQILSRLSGYITLITMPQTITAQLRHVQLVQVDPGRAMLIVVTDNYQTQSALLELFPGITHEQIPDPDLVERELQILSNFLNTHLRGRPLLELPTLDWSELGREFERYADFLRALLSELSRRSQPPTCTQILISGVSEVLRQPEFSELQQVQTLLQLLEVEQGQLWPLIFESPEMTTHSAGKRVNLWIGAENPLEPMRSCALVSATYRRGTTPVGSVGMLGPTRMVYETAIAVVEATADYLSEALSQSRGINDATNS